MSSAETVLAITDLASDGRGVGKLNGKIVFVEGALPGEHVRCRRVKSRAAFDEAQLLQVDAPSADRVAARCKHFEVCGGCTLQHLDVAAQLRFKQKQLLDALRRIGKVEPRTLLPPIVGPAWGYRRRARLGVKFVEKKGRVLVGFHERTGRYIADLSRCEILIEPFQDLPSLLAGLIDSLSVRKDIPQVEIAAGDHAQALVFRVMQEPSPDDTEQLRQFGALHAYAIYLQRGGSETLTQLTSAPPLHYIAGSQAPALEFQPLDFVQVNAPVNRAIIERVCGEFAPLPAERALDLFCGIGNFTLPLASCAVEITGVEGSASAIERARANAERNGIQNATFCVQDLSRPQTFGAWSKGRFDWVLLDPPRAGAMQLLESMSQWAPRRVVYISCHPGSLARDAAILTRTHGYDLLAAGVMDMFAHTMHVESMAVFERHA